MRAVLRLIIAVVVVMAPVFGVQRAMSLLALSPDATKVLTSVVSILVGIAAYSVYVRFVEKRELREFAAQGALTELGWGALVGALLFTGTIGTLAALGCYRITAVGSGSDLIVPLAASVAAGFLEEILFRGVIFRISEESLGTPLALAISAVMNVPRFRGH